MSSIQSVIFFKKFGWNEQKSLNWIKAHNFHPIKPVDKHINSELRYRIQDPRKFKRFRIKILRNGIHLVIGFK